MPRDPRGRGQIRGEADGASRGLAFRPHNGNGFGIIPEIPFLCFLGDPRWLGNR